MCDNFLERFQESKTQKTRRYKKYAEKVPEMYFRLAMTGVKMVDCKYVVVFVQEMDRLQLYARSFSILSKTNDEGKELGIKSGKIFVCKYAKKTSVHLNP